MRIKVGGKADMVSAACIKCPAPFMYDGTKKLEFARESGQNSFAQMITISSLLSEPYIILPMRATDRSTAIHELLEPLEKNNIIDSSQECLESILKRERRMSTGIGKGVALPHGLSESIREVALVLGISPAGVDFNAVDGALCHIFVLLISPAREPDKHLKMLSRLSKYLSDGEQRSAMIDAATPGQVLKILRTWEAEEEDVTL